MNKIFCFFILIFFLVGCSQNRPDEKIYTETKLYSQGMSMLKVGKSKDAIKKFYTLSTMYPFSHHGMKAQVRLAEINYDMKKYDDAVHNCNMYLQFYPEGEDIIYMHHLRALANYKKGKEVDKNSENLLKAQSVLEELIQKYPESEYSDEARVNLRAIIDDLAQKELSIAKFYFNRGEYVAALNRLNNIIYGYKETNYYAPALFMLVNLYIKLGIYEMASDYYEILDIYFPDSKWAHHAAILLNQE